MDSNTFDIIIANSIKRKEEIKHFMKQISHIPRHFHFSIWQLIRRYRLAIIGSTQRLRTIYQTLPIQRFQQQQRRSMLLVVRLRTRFMAISREARDAANR